VKAEIEDLKKLKREVLKEFPTYLIENPDGSIVAAIPQRIIEHKDGSIEIEYIKPDGTLRAISFKRGGVSA